MLNYFAKVSFLSIALSLNLCPEAFSVNSCVDLLKNQTPTSKIKVWINASENNQLKNLSYEKNDGLANLLSSLSRHLFEGEKELTHEEVDELLQKRLSKPSALKRIKAEDLMALFSYLNGLSREVSNQQLTFAFLKSPGGFLTKKETLEGIFNLVKKFDSTITNKEAY